VLNPFLWTIIAALGAALGYASPWLQVPAAVLLLPLALIFLGLAAPSPRQAFRYCWRAGSVASLVCLYWVFWPVEHYGGVHWALAIPVPVLLSMAMGCYYGLLGLAVHFTRRVGPVAGTLAIGAAWTVMELAQATLLSGFSWLTLSSAFVAWPIFAQGAAFVGAYGLSGLLVLIPAGLVHSTRGVSAALVSALSLALVLGLGWQRMSSFSEHTPAHTVAIAQGNIDQGVKWDPDYQRATVQKYVDLSRHVLETARPELIVWPETAMPFYFQDNTPLNAPVEALLKTGGASIVLGAPAYGPSSGPGGYTLFNRAFLLDSHSPLRTWYDKEHLVPFGEYMPLAGILPIQKLVTGVGDFIPGQNANALKSGDLALGVLVCYEAIFAGLAQDRVSQGANLLVNISNDAWFGDTSAPHQHLQLAALRAIEQGRYLVRSTNTGISAFIDPLGRIKVAGPQFQALSAASTVHPHTEFTFFHSYYETLGIALGIAVAILGFLIIRGGEDTAETLVQQ
jgi:apolipoprotein N-acyltransferase